MGSIIAGFGGLYYVMDYACGIWSNDAFGDRGWLAIALVIFAIWRPNVSIIGSIVFGGLLIIHNYIPGLSFSGQEILKMTPYVVTILVLIIISMRQKRENQPPASLGLSYFREERLLNKFNERDGRYVKVYPCPRPGHNILTCNIIR